jgi:D-alanine-D-alanine ligase
MNVTVLYGGDSAEREISLLSGRAVSDALVEAGHDVTEVDLLDYVALEEDVAESDVVFPVLHGGPGEDGRVQAVLELAGLAYVGSRPGPSAVAMDKVWTKQLARQIGVPTADWLELGPADDLLSKARSFGFPCVLKPVLEGSAIGVHILQSEADAAAVSERRRTPWLLERYIPGRELTLPFLLDEAMALVEIRPKQGFYDYRNKYTKGASEYDCPASLATNLQARIAAEGTAIYRALRLRDMARLDYRLAEDGTSYLLEANTIPGMTALSLLPMGCKARGIDFVAMCDRLVRHAHERGPDHRSEP